MITSGPWWSRSRVQRAGRQARRGKRRPGPSRTRWAELELLEPRLLLSGDDFASAPLYALPDVELPFSQPSTEQFPTPPALYSADAYEPNESLGAASNLGQLSAVLSISGLTIHTDSDEDYFRFQTTATGTGGDYVRLTLVDGSGSTPTDIDTVLLDSGGSQVGSSTGTGLTEQISLNGLAAGTYYVRVYGYSDSENQYSMTIAPPVVPPELTVTGGTTPYKAGLGATVVDAGLTISNGDAGSVSSAAASIVSGLKPTEDRLQLPAIAGITTDYSTATGVLTITSSAGLTYGQWQTILRQVQYDNAQTPFATLNNRSVRFTLSGVSSGNKTLSVDLPLDAGIRGRIKEAFSVIQAVGEGIINLAGPPMYTDETEVPYTGGRTVTDLFYPHSDELDANGDPVADYDRSIQPQQIGSFLALSAAVSSYLDGAGDSATAAGLNAAIASRLASIVAGTAPRIEVGAQFVKPADTDARSVQVTITVSTSQGDPQALDLGEVARDLNLRLPDDPSVTVGGGAEIELSILADLQGHTYGGALEQDKLTLSFETLEAAAGLSFDGLDTTVEVGAIRGQVETGGGSIVARFPVAFSGGASRTLDNWSAGVGAVTGFGAGIGTAGITLPISASIGGVSATTGNTRLVIEDDDLFDSDAATYTTTDFDKLQFFATITVENIIQEILNVGGLYETLENSGEALFGLRVPFVTDTTLGDLFDFSLVFDEAIGSQVDVVEATLNTAGRDELTDPRLPLSDDSQPKPSMWSDLRAGFQFGMVINNDWPVHAVTVAADNSRQTLDDLVADVNTALNAAGLDVEAGNSGNKIVFKATDVSIRRFAIVPVAPAAGRLTPTAPPADLGTLAIGTACYYQVTGTASGAVKGTNYYTLDTSVAAAAVHAGLLSVGQTGIVMVTRVGALSAWGSTRNGILSADAASQQMYLIASADVDIRRLGIVSQEGALGVLESLTQGTLRASLPLEADLTGDAAFQVAVGVLTCTVTVTDHGRADRLATLDDVRSAMQSAGIASSLLDARLVDSQGNAAGASLDAAADYFVQLFLPTGSSANTFSVTPISDIRAYELVPLGFLVGEASASPRPEALRTFQDFQNATLFPDITITPVYDNVADTVTLQFQATRTLSDLAEAAGIGFDIAPLSGFTPGEGQTVEFSPALSIAFGLEFQVGPTSPVLLVAGDDAPNDGRLTGAASFTVDLVLDDRYDVTVPKAWTDANADVQDLIGDVNRALKQAIDSLGATVDLTTDRLVARRNLDNDRLELVTAVPTNSGAAITLAHTGGRLSSDLAAAFTHDGVQYILSVDADATSGNTTWADLVLDVHDALSSVTVDANGNGVVDTGEGEVSLAASVFVTTVSDASGARVDEVRLFATDPPGSSWPAVMNVLADGTAVSELGLTDGGGASAVRLTATATPSAPLLRNHTGGSAFASGILDLALPSHAGSVRYGFNTLDFAAIENGSIDLKASVSLADGADLATRDVGSDLAGCFERTLTGADGTGSATAEMTLTGITAASGAAIDADAEIRFTIPDLGDTTVVVEQAIGLPIPVPQASANGTLSGDATVNFLHEGAKYSVTVTAAAAAGNTTFAQLAGQFDAALAAATETVLGVPTPDFDAGDLFTIVADDGQLEVRAKVVTDNPDYATVELLPNLSAFGEVGRQGAFGLDTVVQSLVDSLAVYDEIQDGLEQFSGFALPLINAPLADLIDIKGDLLRRFTRLGEMSVSAPAELAPALAAALSVPSSYVRVTFDSDLNSYRVDYQFETGLLTTRALDIALADFYRFTDQTAPEGLARLVDTGAASPLTVKILAVSVLSVGIDLTDPDQPRTFLYGHDGSDDWSLSDGSANGTSFQVHVQIVGEGINFTAALGAFGVFVRDGNACLGGAAVMAGDDPVYEYDADEHQLHPLRQSDAAELTVTLADGRHYLSPAGGESDALELDNYAAAFEGTVDVNLPLYTPTEFINPFTNRTVEVFLLGDGPTEVHPGGNLADIKILDLDAFAAAAGTLRQAQAEIGEIYTAAAADGDRDLTQDEEDRVAELEQSIADLRSSGVVEIYTPDVEDANSGVRAPTLFDLLRDPAILVDGLDIILGAIETGLRGLDNLDLPVIGPVLGSAADGVFAWRSGWLLDLKHKMRGQGEAVLEAAKDQIYDFLGPNGIDLLLKDNGIRSVAGMLPADGPDDVTLDFVDADGNKLTDMGGYGAYGVEFKLRLGSVLVDTGVNLSFDFSALEPALSLSLDGGLDFKLGWDITLGFGINLDDGFYLIVDSDPTANELELRFEAYLRGDQSDYDVAADPTSPTGYTIVDGDGEPVLGPRKGNGSRDILRAMPVLASGANAPEGTAPDTINGCRNTTPGGPLIDEDNVYWVVAAEGEDDQWVPVYLDQLGYFRPQQGEDWEDFSGSADRNPDEMVLFDRTGPLSLHGELFFLQMDVTDTIQRGLEPKGDADYFYDPSAASTITAYGRNNSDAGVNRNNALPTRVAGRIGVNISDPSANAGDRVARPGPTETGFMLMDGSDALGGQPVLDEQGNLTPVQYTDGQWYVMTLTDGELTADGLITDDPSANHITFAEMREAGISLFELVLNAEAVVNLGLTLYVSDDANIPRLTASLNLDWRTDSMTPPPNPFAATTQQKLDLVPEVGINDIRLDMGSFLTSLIKPIAEKIDDALKPVDPLIDVLETPIPILSDIAGRDIKLTTLLVNFGGPKGKAVGTVIEMIVLVRQLSAVMAGVPDDANVYLPIGSFWLAKVGAGPFGQPGLGRQIYYDNNEVSAPSITQRNQSMIAESGGGLNSVTDALGSLDQMDRETSTQEGITDRSQRGGFSVPILQDPITIFKLLMGEDVPLVTYSLPTLDFSLSISIPLARIVILEVGLRLDFQVKGQLKVGYDTYGIRMFHESRDPADLLDGFYISDRRNADGTGDDVNEFYVRAGIALYGEVDAVLAKAGIEGGFTFTGSINLNDPNNDGKLRLPEMIDLVAYTGNPIDLADLHFSGEVYARYYYWVGLRVWTPWKTYTITLYSGGKTFARMTLFSLTREGNDGPPTFASEATTIGPDGTEYDDTLIIHAGPSAAKRVSNQDPLRAADGSEYFEVWNDSSGSGTVHVRYRNFSGTETQTFTGVSRVVFTGGAGNDTIDASGLRGLPVEFDGGDGSDVLLLGSGSAGELSTLKGGSGDDTIVVSGEGLVRIEGEDGNDVISAGTGVATLLGGPGGDTITGGGDGSSNTFRFDRQFGIDTLILHPLAAANVLDFSDASSAIAANLESVDSTVAAGDSNRVTFDLGSVTEIRGTLSRDTFHITNPTTRDANSGRGLVIRGGEGIDTYNIQADDLSGLAADGITLDDGIYPSSTASVGEAKVCEFCGEILAIAVADAGYGYVAAPEVLITDATGSGARAVAGIDDQGRVTGIYVLSGGLGYTDPTIELVSRASVGDKLVYSASTDATVTLDRGGNGGSDYRITSGDGSIKWVGWDQPGVTRPDNYGISEMDNLEFNLPNAAVVVDADVDVREMLNVTAKRLVQNAAATADTIKIATQRGLQINHPLHATNNGDIVLRVTGRGLEDYADALAQAAAQATAGRLTDVVVTDGGAYYDFAPIVSIHGANGAGARAAAEVSDGQVVAINITDAGDGYFSTPAPTVRVASPASIQINAPLTSSTVGSDPGTGDGRGTFTLRADLGSIDMGGYVDFPDESLIAWADGDFVYRSSNTLDDITADLYAETVGGSGAAAEAVLDEDGRVVAIHVLAGGTGYSSSFLPAVEIQGMAEATALVEGGQVVGFRITNPGYGYATAPAVTIRSNGFGKIVGADADQTALNRVHLKSANGYLVAVAYEGIGRPDQPLRTDVRNLVAQTFADGAGVHVLEKDSLAIGLIDQVNGISTVDGDVSIALFGGTASLGTPVQQTNASGQLLWQDADKTIPIYVVDGNGNILYEGGRLMVGLARVQITADDIDVNSMVSATGGILELQPVRFDTPIGLTGTRATAEAVVEGGQVAGFTELWGGRGYSTEPLVIMPPPGERAFGVASILNGQVTGINLVYGGTRYGAEHPPTVTLVGGGQDGQTPADPAVATAQYDAGGHVTGFTITHAGSGYYTAPEVVIALPGEQATAEAVVVDGVVVGLSILNPGSNYASAPTVTIAQPYAFNLDGDEIAFFQDGFLEVIIGRADGSHTIYAPGVVFQDNVRLRAPRTGGNFQTESLVVESGGGLVIVGSGHTYYLTTANPVTSGTYVEIDDSVRVNDGVDGQIIATDSHVSIFGTGKGKIDGQAGSVTEHLTITAGTTITVTGAIGSQDPLTSLTLNSVGGGTINLQQNVTLDGDLHIVNGGTLSLGGDLVIGGDLIIDDAANISFSGTVTVTGDLIIAGAGTVNFAQNVQVGGDLIIGSLINPTGVSAVTLASTARLDVAGSVEVYAASQIVFGASVGQTSPPTSMTLRSDGGDVSFQDVTVAGAITVAKARDVTFVQELTTDQLTITNATGQARFQGLTTLGTAEITATNLVQVQSGLRIADGDATITSNEIDFAGGTGTVLYIGAGVSLLTLKPRTTSRAITVGSPPGVFTSLDLSDSDLAAIGAGFERVVIGDAAAGTGAVTVGSVGSTQGAGNSQFLNDTSIHGGSINVVQNVDAAEGVDLLQMVARTGNVIVGGALNSDAADRSAELRLQTLDPTGQVLVNQPIGATDLIAIVSGHAVSAGASGTVQAPNLRITAGDAVTLNNANAVDTLAIDAGDHNVTFRDDSGFAIGTVDGAAGVNSGTADTTLTTTGTVTQTAPVTARGLLLLGTGGSYALTNVANDADVLAATTGSLSFRDADGLQIGTIGSAAGITTAGAATVRAGTSLEALAGAATTADGAVVLEALAGDLTLPADADIDADGPVTIAASGRIYSAADVTTTGHDVGFNAPLTLTGDVQVSTGAGAGDVAFQTVDGALVLGVTAGAGNLAFGQVGGATPLSSLTVTSADVVTFGDDVATTGAQAVTANTVETHGTHATSGADIDIAASLSMQADTTLTTGTGAGDIALEAIVGHGYDLAVVSGGGTATIGGDAAGLARVTLQTDHADATGMVSFLGDLQADQLVTFGRGYDVRLLGDTVQVATAVAMLNTGGVWLGGDESDVLTFTGGLSTSGNATNPLKTYLGGTVRSAGGPVALGAVELTADSVVDTTNDGGSAGADIAIAGDVTGDYSLTLVSGTGTQNVRGELNVGEALLSGRQITIDQSITADAITIDGDVVLEADVTFAASGDVTINGTVSGDHRLTIVSTGGTATLNGSVDVGVELAIDAPATCLNGGSVETTGTQTYTGAVTLGQDTTLTGTTVTFHGTVDAAEAGEQGLAIVGDAVFNEAVGDGQGLELLTVSGTADLNGGTVATTGIQTYAGAATLGQDTTLTGTTVTFHDTVDATEAGEQYLAVTGDAVFNEAVGDGQGLELLTVSGTLGLNGGTVETTGIQTYTGAATLDEDTTLTGTTVTFHGTVDATVAGEQGLAITGHAVLDGAVGDAQVLEFLTVSGTAGLNGGSVETTGVQTYTGAATLGQDTTLTGTTVTFHGTVDAADAGEQGLAVTGAAVFNEAVGDGEALEFLTVSGTADLNGGTVETTGIQTYTGAATLGQDTMLTGTTVTFHGTVDATLAGEQGLAVTGNAVFNEAVGDGEALEMLTVSGTADLNGGTVETTGIQTYTGAATLGQDTTLTGTTVTFHGTLDATEAGEQGLAVTGNAVFNGAVGDGEALEFLTVSGTADLNGGTVETTGIQTYTGAATLGQDTTLTGTTVTFHGTLDATLAGEQGLAITGDAVFNDAVGDGQALEFLTVSGTADLNGGTVETTGIQTYTGAATLGQDTALTGTTVTFHGTVDATLAGEQGLAITGDAVFHDAVGGGQGLELLTVSGTTDLNGDLSAGSVVLTGDVEVLADLAIDAPGGLAMHGNLSGGHDLTVNTDNSDLLVAGETDLASLTIQNAGEVQLGAVTTGSLTQLAGTGVTQLTGAVVVTEAGGISITTAAIEVRDDLTSGAGPIALAAAETVNVAAGVHITAAGDVTIDAGVEVVLAENSRIAASGAAAVDVSCDGGIAVDGRVQTASGDIQIRADRDTDGDGSLVMASNADVTVVTTDGDITLAGRDVTLGSAEYSATVTSLHGDITILGGAEGVVTLANRDSRIGAGGSVTIGDADAGEGTPGEVSLAGWITGQTIGIRSLGDINADDLRAQATGDVDLAADNDIAVSNSLLVSFTGTVNLVSDADGDEAGTTVLLNSRVIEGVTLPDLETTVTLYRTGESLRAGDAGRVRVWIANVGQLRASGLVDVLLYLSSTPTLGDDAVLLAARNNVRIGINPGRTAWRTLSFTMPAPLANGEYYLIAQVAPSISISDINVANNTAALETPIEVCKGDLAPAAVACDLGEAVLVGATGRATVTVANLAPVPVAGRVEVRLYATTTGELAGAIQVGQTTTTLSLAAGDDRRVTVSLAMPDVAGDYRLLAVVDAADDLAEDDETNNALLGEAEVTVAERFVDLEATVTGSALPAAALPGAGGAVDVLVRNLGNVPAGGTVTVDVFASTDGELDGGDVQIGTADVRVSLSPGAGRTCRANVTLPEGLTLGDYTLIARLTPQAPLTDSNAANDADAFEQAVTVTRPDLTPTAIASSLDETVLTQDSGRATVTVTNAGLVRAAGSVQVRVYSTTTGDLADGVEVGRTTATLSLGAGASKDVGVPVTMPDVPGDHQLLAVVDAADNVAEVDETNNTLLGEPVVTVVERFVDLEATIAQSRVPVAVLPGEGGSVTVVVRNLGNVRAGGIVTIDVFASTDGELDGGDVPIGTADVRVSLSPDAGRAYTVNVTLPADLEMGDYMLIARLTPRAPLADNNAANDADAFEQAVTVTRGDLRPTLCESTFRPVALPGERGRAAVRFVNDGQVTARGRVNVVIYATTTGALDGAVEIGRTNDVYVSLSPGRSKSLSVPVRLPSTAADYQILVAIDDSDAMGEADEGNNTLLADAGVEVCPPFVDLVTVDPSLRVTGPVAPGARCRATVTLRNDGNITARGYVEIRLYASTDRTFGASDAELRVLTGRSVYLRPGRTRTFTVYFTMPADIDEGDYYLVANIQPDLRLSFLELVDTNLTNNVTAASDPFTVAA